MEPSIYTALLSIFPPQSEKNVQVRSEKKEMALKGRFQSFVYPGSSFQKFT